jgi:hypothetical protein
MSSLVIARDVGSYFPIGGDYSSRPRSCPLDAAPHIQNYRCQVTFSGSRSYEAMGVTYSETLAGTFTQVSSRVSIRPDTATGVWVITTPPFGSGIGDDNDDFIPDFFDYYRDGLGEFTAKVSGGRHIGQQEFQMRVKTINEVVGTYERTEDGVPPITGDIIANVHFIPMFKNGTERVPATFWELSTTYPPYYGAPTHFGDGVSSGPVGIDISEWSIFEWRSKIGTYNATLVETSWNIGTGGTSSVEVAYEWEFS